MQLVINTDGGARDNGKVDSVASYGACGRFFDEECVLKKRFLIVQRVDSGTNNQMELLGVISALRIALKQNETKDVSIVMDSAYVRNGITDWINTWKSNGWKTSKKKPVKNIELWQLLDELYIEANQKLDLEMKKVKGHADDYANEHIDSACTWAMNNLENQETKAEWSDRDDKDWKIVWTAT